MKITITDPPAEPSRSVQLQAENQFIGVVSRDFAHLLAAAPELLETVRHLESILVHRNNMLPDPKEMIRMCRSAIAKAEGRNASPGRAEENPTQPQQSTEAK